MWNDWKENSMDKCIKKCGGGAENSIAELFYHKILPSAERQMTDK